MKAIILAGGNGTRLYPMTKVVSKQLLPVYNKPMILYPLTALMLAGIQDILIISKSADTHLFERLLGDGRDLGINISYATQDEPKGIAEAIIIAEPFIDNGPFTLILGDNIFFGAGLGERIKQAAQNNIGATIFVHRVSNPQAYGVVELDDAGTPISLVEKPTQPKSNWAVTGLYIYTPEAIELAKVQKPSDRGELEITDLNRSFLEQQKLKVDFFGRGYCWLDMGTPENMLDAGNYVRTIEERQGLKVCDPYEVAQLNGWI